MKISYNWLRQFIDTDKTPQELSLILTNIGLEVESLDKVQAVIGGLEGLRIGKVISCEQHPNADRLRITNVTFGGEEKFQIVCGAPNVAAGQTVVVAPVGCTVYPNEGEPFKIKESKIRGEVSQGMICAEDEIGLGKSHEGIMVLSNDAQLGQDAASYFKLNDDFVFEIGLTPNRADAASHLGVARDLAAYLEIELKMPGTEGLKQVNNGLEIPVTVLASDDCKRYSSLTIAGVQVAESPSWIQDRLKIIGLRPINNIVDITNYVLHELGQPLHAFDAAKISGGVFVKKFEEGTLFTTLDDVSRKLGAEDLLIADANGPLCIAGVFGGKDSGVSASTTDIFLESAWFDSVSVRKTSKRHNLKTDASFRFERGTDPDMTVLALKRAATLIQEIAGGQVSELISDIYPSPVQATLVPVTYEEINKLIGTEIPAEKVNAILTGLGITLKNATANGFTAVVPPFKVDVTRPCDIIEEVLRIYGYDNVPIPAKVNASLSNAQRPDREQTQHFVADMLSGQGYAEIWCNSLTQVNYTVDAEKVVEILNPLSSDLGIMRQSLLHPALESVAYNQNRKMPDLKFYEFGKIYNREGEGFQEIQKLLLLQSGSSTAELWSGKQQAVTFYDLKGAVHGILNRLGILNFQSEELVDPLSSYGLRYYRGPQEIVKFGAVAGSVKKLTGVDRDVFYAEFNWNTLLDIVAKQKIKNKEVPKSPSVRRDLSMLVDKKVTFDALRSIAFRSDKQLIREVNIFDVFLGGKNGSLPEGKKSYAISFTLQDDQQTLTDKQIDAVMQKIIHNLAKEVNAEIRK